MSQHSIPSALCFLLKHHDEQKTRRKETLNFAYWLFRVINMAENLTQVQGGPSLILLKLVLINQEFYATINGLRITCLFHCVCFHCNVTMKGKFNWLLRRTRMIAS